MCLMAGGTVLGVTPKMTKKQKPFQEVQLLVDHGQRQEIMKIAVFGKRSFTRGENAVGENAVPVVADAWVGRNGAANISYVSFDDRQPTSAPANGGKNGSGNRTSAL